MTPEEFAQKIYDKLTIKEITEYRKIFEVTAPKDVSDPYFIEALSFFENLSDYNKGVLFAIIRQVSIDTVAGYYPLILVGV